MTTDLATTNREQVKTLLLAMMDSGVFYRYDPVNEVEQRFIDAGLLDYTWLTFPSETGMVGTYTVTDRGKQVVDSIVNVDMFVGICIYYACMENFPQSVDNVKRQAGLAPFGEPRLGSFAYTRRQMKSMASFGLLQIDNVYGETGFLYHPTPFGCTVFNAMAG